MCVCVCVCVCVCFYIYIILRGIANTYIGVINKCCGRVVMTYFASWVHCVSLQRFILHRKLRGSLVLCVLCFDFPPAVSHVVLQ